MKIGFYKSFSFVLAAEVSKCGWCPKLVNDRCLRILLKVKLFLTTLNHFSLLSISVIVEYEKAVQQSMAARESFFNAVCAPQRTPERTVGSCGICVPKKLTLVMRVYRE